MKKSAFEKRVKRRIVARSHRFFAVCAPGLKQLCSREISALLPAVQNVEMIAGGVEFTGTVHDCCAANLFLRSPSRIIMRVARFKAENFRTLEKKLAAVEWELYLKRGASVAFEVSATHSRLYHKDAIAQRAKQVIMDHFDSIAKADCMTDGSARHTLMIRGENDYFEVSLDSSGDLLHKRGIKKHVGAAPLRETLAFAILSAAGYSGEEVLIDGMCGSGSFVLEAAMIAGNIPPGYFRSFAFEQWPGFVPARWHHLKKETALHRKAMESPSIIAMDQDGTMLGHLEKTLRAVDLSSAVMTIKHNFFDFRPEMLETLSGKKGIVVLNPPYGKRIGERKERDTFFRELAAKLESDFRGWKAGIILPDKNLMDCFSVSGGALMPLFHGGLELHAVVLTL